MALTFIDIYIYNIHTNYDSAFFRKVAHYIISTYELDIYRK